MKSRAISATIAVLIVVVIIAVASLTGYTVFSRYGLGGTTIKYSYSSSDISLSNPCGAYYAYNNNQNNSASANFTKLLANVENYSKFAELEGNRTGYQYGGGGCGPLYTNSTAAGSQLLVMFDYVDSSHPSTVCGNSTTWPHYEISVGVYLTQTGYDLSRSTFSQVYFGPTNTTVTCTTKVITMPQS
jgi:hypothetical protein